MLWHCHLTAQWNHGSELWRGNGNQFGLTNALDTLVQEKFLSWLLKLKYFLFFFFFFHCFKFIYFLTKLGRETKFKWFNICHPELLSPEFFFKTTLMRGLFLVWADFHFNWCLFLLLYSAWEPVGILKKACCVAECPGRIQHCSSSEEPINHDLETPASVPFSCVQRKRNTGSLLCSFVDTEYLESTRGQIKTCRLELF